MLGNIQVFLMRNVRNPGIIRAKVSTMPRNQSDASSQLELYKMVTEKQRIQRELCYIKERTTVLQQRLDILNGQIEDTERTIKKFRQPQPSATQNIVSANTFVESNNYQTFEIEY
ncbi:MAG: gas vesicle protein [Cyanobacteriota bacterium]|jgi:peptidoglycan hydrolase CwlO-like protein